MHSHFGYGHHAPSNDTRIVEIHRQLYHRHEHSDGCRVLQNLQAHELQSNGDTILRRSIEYFKLFKLLEQWSHLLSWFFKTVLNENIDETGDKIFDSVDCLLNREDQVACLHEWRLQLKKLTRVTELFYKFLWLIIQFLELDAGWSEILQ